MTSELPRAQRGFMFRSTSEKPKIENIETPKATPGSVVVRLAASSIAPYAHEIFSGKRNHPLPKPSIPGVTGVGRVAATGPDATSLEPGQLVYVDGFVHARDDSSVRLLFGVMDGYTPKSARLMKEVWRNGTWAEYSIAPLENVFPLNENRLIKELGYTIDDLAYITTQLIPFGGLDDVALKAGERVLIAPATGWFGGGAVMAALAMGASVVAAGRDTKALEDIRTKMDKAYGAGRVDTVQITGDSEKDTAAFSSFGPLDVFLELSPPTATDANYVQSALKSLGYEARVSFMGGVMADVPVPLGHIVFNNIQLKGKMMYKRDAILRYIKMVERGVLKLGEKGGVDIVGKWPLDKWEEALEESSKHPRLGKLALFQF